MNSAKKLLYNTLLLTGAAMLMRAVGVSFQVYLSNQIGSAGIGLFQLISSAQMLATTVALSGIRYATTRLVSEELGLGHSGGIGRVMRRCFTHALVFGSAAGAVLFLGAGYIGNVWIGDSRTILSLRILAVSLPFVACSATMGGYFTAVQRVVKAASMQVVEFAIRIAVVVGLLVLYAPSGLEYACAAVVIGGVVAEILSTLILFFIYLLDRRQLPAVGDPPQNIARRLLGISMPLAISTYARSGLNTLQHMLVPRGLRQSGASGESALETYGLIHGMVFPILTFPSALFYSVAELIVPELTEAQVAGKKERISHIVNRLLRISLYISIGLTALFLAYGRQLGGVIYTEPEVGDYIRLLALLTPVMFMDAIADGILKGLGQQVYSMGVNIADSLISVVLVYFLLPAFAVNGYIFMVYFTECFNFALSLWRITRITTVRINLMDLLRPVLSALGSVSFASLILRLLGFPLATTVPSVVVHILLASAIYTGLLFTLGCITRRDVAQVRRLLG